jgi:hypothetical protein
MVGFILPVEGDGASTRAVWDSGPTRVQGWKGSVKARHLVMAMRDHFAEPSQRAAAAQAAALEKIRAIVDASHPGTSSEKVGEVADAAGELASRAAEIDADEDNWALSHIKINRVQVRSQRHPPSPF